MEPRLPTEDPRLVAGRFGAKLFVAAGLLVIVNTYIPPVDHLNRPVLQLLGAVAIACGLLAAVIRWELLPSRATLSLGFLGLTFVAVGNLFGGVSSYSYAVYFIVVFVFIGITQPPRTAYWMALPAVVAYVAPALLRPGTPAIAALSSTTAIPVCVLVGEVISRRSARLNALRKEADYRADLLHTVAHASRLVNALDVDAVLEGVLNATASLSMEACEIRTFNEKERKQQPLLSRGLPSGDGDSDLDAGLSGRVRRTKATVVVSDYSSSEYALPSLVDAGFKGVVSCPIIVGGKVTAAFTVGTRTDRTIGPQDVEAVEMLAGVAGRAIENATQFDEQRLAMQRLSELDRLKDDFLSNISHELRTPLTVIAGMGQTLDKAWERISPERRRDLLQRLNRNAEALDQIITTLLDFSRLDAGRLQLRPQVFDFGGLIESVAARLTSLFDEHDFHVTVDPGSFVQADPVLIERVVENLLSNAVRHTPEGTRVAATLTQRGDGWEFTARDNGPGIPPSEIEQLGHRFFRGGDPDGRTSRGVGLGLAFCSEILRLHNSALQIQSSLGLGSAFSFVLTRVDAPSVETAATLPE